MFDVLPSPLRASRPRRRDDRRQRSAPRVVPARRPAREIRHPIVPGFERFHTGDDLANDANQVEGGLILLGELGCTSCHAPDAALAGQVFPKQAPILDQVGSRVRPGYIRAFLNDPQAVKPGTTMPHLFAALPADEKAATVEALVHFLATTGTVYRKGSRAEGDRQRQEALSRDRLRRLPRPPRSARCRAWRPRCRWATWRASTRSRASSSFLQDPLKVRPTGRMPALNLVKNEATELASYLA